MPRRIKPKKHIPFHFPQNEKSKKRFSTEQMALRAAELRTLEHPELDLTVYKGMDGGWYLTRKKQSSETKR